jgi:catechol 1,2-dioxygenase
LVVDYTWHDQGGAPDPDVKGPWYTMEHRLVIQAGESRKPAPPITGKANGERPMLEVLQRR